MPDNVFDGPPDARQSDDIALPTSRFRPRYRALSDEEKRLHDEIKFTAEDMERLFDKIPDVRHATGPVEARYRALAITALEESIMWAIKALTA